PNGDGHQRCRRQTGRSTVSSGVGADAGRAAHPRQRARRLRAGLTGSPAVPIGSSMDAAELTAFAEELATAARAETLGRWASGCAVEDKGFGAYDPVTEADREAERAMCSLIRERHPDHGVTGEEWPDEPGTSAYRWSLDPIDG